MINQLLESFKDPARRGPLFAMLYFVAIVITAWTLYSLPSDLVYKGGMIDNGLATAIYAKAFIVVAVTLGLGVTAINLILKHKKEVIVYLEKKDEKGAQQNTGFTAAETLDLETFRKSIAQASKGELAQTGLNLICKMLQAGQGALYLSKTEDSKRLLELKGNFALALGESETIRFEFGEGLVGQAAASASSLYVDEVPEGYINIVSGLGSAQPRFLFVTPIKKDKEVKGVIEVATFNALSESVRRQAEEMSSILAETLTQK
jgi:hypothetical protein